MGELWHGLQALDRGDGIYAVIHWRDSYFQHWVIMLRLWYMLLMSITEAH